jgi:CRP-like cAMP-binding protein
MARVSEEAEIFYLIEFGEVGIFHDGVQVGKLRPGGYFGTMALLDKGPYQFTYRALSKVTALTVARDKFDPLLRADTTLAHQVSSGAQERQLLREMPLFSSLSPQELAAIDTRLQHKNVQEGEVVVRQGDPRSDLFIVATGLIEVMMPDEAGVLEVNGRLGPGEHFGEYALFADTPYQATYRAAQDTELLLLDEEKFDELVADSERMLHYVEQIGSGRLIATRRRLGPSGLIS